ncbi:MAG: preprotein translocase subunit SecY [Candidatus Gastranaerophilales bacterium]|nr:preprotein translocase subunit SecY [Candidatus Gastranaerophilales bacterium]
MQQKIDSDKVVQNLMASWQASGLKQKLIFTFAIIALFRFCAQLPIYGINNEVFQALASGNNLIGFLDMFSGGALGKVSIFALGIGPYITSSIIMQLMAVIVPSLERAQKEDGEAGRRKIQQITRVFTVGLALFQSLIFALALYKLPGAIMPGVDPVMFFVGSAVSLTAGSVIVMWLAELITEKGVGNGASLIIFVGIIAGIPLYCNRTATLVSQDAMLQLGLLALVAIFLATIVFIIVLHEAARKVPIVSARRQVGNKVYGGQNTSIPFKLNPGGVMPIIFAIAILLFPATVLGFVQQMHIENVAVASVFEKLSIVFSANSISYYVIYFVLIVTLTFFYASIIPSMQPKEIANNLKKYGSAIPGVKPGKPTADKLNEILSRTTLIGALALGIIAMIPTVATKVTGITTFQGIGATSLIILVGVALDFINQIKTHMLAKNYESFLQQQ